MNDLPVESFPSGYRFVPGKDTFPLSTDTMVLADFVRLRPESRVVDLGSGSGALGLLLCGACPTCTVTGVELHEVSHLAARRNIEENDLHSRLRSIHGDLRQIRQLLPAGSFDCVVSNPPYFSSGEVSKLNPNARQELTATLDDIFSAAAWLLRTGGDFFLVHKPDRLSDLLVLARAHHLEAKVLQLVCHRPGDAPALVLLQCRRGGKPGLRIPAPIFLREDDGSPSVHYRRIYHL